MKLESELGGERLTEESKARPEVISVLIGTRCVARTSPASTQSPEVLDDS